MQTLSQRLRERIAACGPLTVAEYMEAALLDPDFGYYTTRMPFGREGDFTTAPEISQIFGELIGLWLADAWMRMGSPRAVLAEPGPGRGTLMKDILRATARVPGFHEHISVRMIEASPALVAVQQRALAGMHPRVTWHETLDGLPPLPLLLVANEWFDALPIRQFIRTPQGWRERMVDTDDTKPNRFKFVLSPNLTALSAVIPAEVRGSQPLSSNRAYSPEFPERPGMAHKESKELILETCEPALTAMRRIAAHIARYGGAALIIDYGYSEPAYGDTLQAVKAHAFHDPLASPGTADITAHVNFAALASAAKKAGVQAHGPIPQGVWLKRLGAELRAVQLCRQATPAQRDAILSGLHRLASPESMGELFKVLAISSLPALDGFT